MEHMKMFQILISFLRFYYFTASLTIAAHMHIIQERAEVRHFNKEIVSNVSFFVNRINETMVALNYAMDLKEDIKNSQIFIKFDAWTKDKYVRTDIVDFDAPFCDIYTDDDFNIFKDCMVDSVRGNFPKVCPDGVIPKGNYFIRECYFDESINLTMYLPGRWRINVDFYNGDDREICGLYLYLNFIQIL